MGMIACYMEAEQVLIDELKELPEDELYDRIEELTEEKKSYDLDKWWDGIHYLLTGTSACTPIKNNLLSESIAGSSTFSDDPDSDFIAYVYPDRLVEIINALKNFDMQEKLSDFSPRELARNGIYPTIWREEEKEELKNCLIKEYNSLIEFYQEMINSNKGIIVSIY